MNLPQFGLGSRFPLQRLLAVLLSAALGGLLSAAVLFGLGPRAAAAAGLAGPAAYSCDQAGLNSALATGGSATFSCSVPTTVTVSNRKTVARDVSLDGGSKLILSGGNVTGVFSVAAGVHLTLLNLTLRDASVPDNGGDVANNGVLQATNTNFISNTAGGGSSVYNAPGATAVISGGLVAENLGEAGALMNGDPTQPNSAPASLTVINTGFGFNEAIEGAAILNFNGPVTVSGGLFALNVAYAGGAIGNLSNKSLLNVSNSQFQINGGIIFAPLAQLPPAPGLPGLQRPAGPGLFGGGAIYGTADSNIVVASSAFTTNVGQQGGGAILYGSLPPVSAVLTPGTLSLVNDTFVENCTSGAGGALSTSETATVSGSSFTQNGAFSGGCVSQSSQARSFFDSRAGSSPRGPAQANLAPIDIRGAGGAIFNASLLSVANTVFLSNTASVTSTGGGGAISDYGGSQVDVRYSSFTANSAWQDGGALFQGFGARANIADTDFTHNSVITDSGGAITNFGALTVVRSSFTNNSGAPGNGTGGGGGAIFSGSLFIQAGESRPSGGNGGPPQAPQGVLAPMAYLDQDTFTSNSSQYEGGALDVGNVTILHSTFLSNTARYGGAIDVWTSPFLLSASTLIGNKAVTTIQGNARQGGAIDSNSIRNVTILNSTFYQNRAEGTATGGAINTDSSGTVFITNTTFLSNTAETNGQGGALAHTGAITLTDSLVAFNAGGNCDTPVHLAGPNLEFPGATCGGASVQADPRALAPADNGGPTLTSALLLGSPAIDAGNNATCAGTDQRGAPRPVGLKCDLGAFEFGGLVPRLWLPIVRR